MAEELDAGKIVAKIVIEVETKQAEEQVNKTVENIKSALTSIGISEPKIKIETQQAEQQVKGSIENIKSEIKSVKNTEAQVNVDTKQAEEQVKVSTEDIKSEIKSVENTNAKVNVDTKQAEGQVKSSAENIKSEIKRVESTEAQVNVDTKQAEQQVKGSTKNINSEVKSVVANSSEAFANAETKSFNAQQKSILKFYEQNKKLYQENQEELLRAINNIAERINMPKKALDDVKEYLGLSKQITEIPAITVKETSANNMYENIRVQLERLGLEATDVNKVIESCFSDLTGYKKYQQQLDILSAKLEIQRKKIEEVRQAKDNAMNGTSAVSQEKAVRAYETESLKLKQLEIQYQNTKVTQESYVNQKVAAYQRGAVAAENAVAKEVAAQQKMQSRTDTALLFADLTTSLRTFNTISPGVINNIGTIVRQLNLLRRASQANASIGMIAATSILSVVGILSTLVINCYNSIKEKQEEARKQAVSLSEAYKENTDSVEELIEKYLDLKTKLDNNAISTEENKNCTEELISIQNELVENYNVEANVIDLVNGKIDEQIEKIVKLKKAKAQEYVAANYNNYNDAKKELEKEKNFDLGNFSVATKGVDYMLKVAEKGVAEEYREKFSGFTQNGGAWSFSANLENAYDELVALQVYTDELERNDKITEDFYNDMRATISSALTSLDTETINNYKNIVEQYENAQNILAGKSEENIEIFENVYQKIIDNASAIESLSSAYDKLSDGENLDISALTELLDTYPKLAQYIAETGDLSLASGEKIKQAQKEILQSNISQLEQEKSILTFKENKNADEEKLLSRITASLSLYRQQLNDINNTDVKTPKLDISDFKTEVDSLGGAYATLKDNKELDLSTTLDLIEKYPEFAEMLNKGSNSIESQREEVEKLFEAKKKEMLMSLQADEQELQSLITTNNTEIQSLKEKMETYSMISSVVTECKLKLGELEGKSKTYSNQLNQVKSQISAINDLNIESYKNTEKSTTNEKLQEQLKLIEHRRALNNLSYAEEISWLQMLYKEYTETAEERMQLEEKIYTAQQNLIKEQDDAIKEQEQAYSDLYNTQISNLEHLKNLDQLSKEQELAWLNTLYSQYVLTAEERMSLEEKIYSAQKEIQEEREQAIKDAMQSELALLEHEKNMDRLSAEDEIAWLERINQSYEMSSEDRMSMEEKIHNAKKSYEEEIQKLQQETLDKKIEALEKARNRSKITYDEELRQLREIYRTQKLTIEQQEQLLEQIRSLQQSAKSDRSSQFSTVGGGVVEALKNKYQEQRDAEEKIINDSIEGWKKWEDETVSAIQSQIDALDELANAQESEDKRREYENKREATELLLKYEKDYYNRQQYIKELNRLDNEEADRLAEEQREQQKKVLQEQIETVKNQSQTQQDLLNAELETISKNYEKVMSSYSLENEAYKMMLNKSQNEIVNFIASYAPEYELAGQTLGEKLYQGLKSKIQNIDYYFQQLDVKWQWYSNQTARVANEAVDQFWSSRAEYERNLNSMAAIPNVNLTVNFNEQVESPVQVAHKMEEVTNNLVNQLKK